MCTVGMSHAWVKEYTLLYSCVREVSVVMSHTGLKDTPYSCVGEVGCIGMSHARLKSTLYSCVGVVVCTVGMSHAWVKEYTL